MKDMKLYVVRKYIKARSIQEAVRLEKLSPAEDVIWDQSWREESTNVGFGKKK